MGLLIRPQYGNGIVIGKGDCAVLLKFAKGSAGLSLDFFALNKVPLTPLKQGEVDQLLTAASAAQVKTIVDRVRSHNKQHQAEVDRDNPQKGGASQ